jgi:hypothetical protein
LLLARSKWILLSIRQTPKKVRSDTPALLVTI